MERTHITTNMDVAEIIFSEQSVCDRLGKNLRGHISEIRTPSGEMRRAYHMSIAQTTHV